METAKKIRMIMLERGVNVKELAELIGTSSSNLSNKLSRNNFKEEDLRIIANALNCEYDSVFTYRDTGKQI